MDRYLYSHILSDLKKKMVFIGGPRQVGKTTLAKSLLKDFRSGLYLNWDDPDQRKLMFQRQWNDSDQLIILDELHKLKAWKNFIKGTWDTQHEHHRFVVTGSARLDVYRRGGDSMLGRYHYWRLHPFCLAEHPPGLDSRDVLQRLLSVGGFPEPFLENDEVFARRWRRERHDRVLTSDIRDLERLENISSLGLLIDLLRERVGSEISMSNLALDLNVSPHTIKKWIQILERMYLVFLVTPYTAKLARAISKPPKIYFFDPADTSENIGSRFENLVACGLLKRLHFLEDSTGHRFELRFLRDREDHEVDFLILKDRKVVELIEVKTTFKEPSKSLIYFGKKIGGVHLTQICMDIESPYIRQGVQICSPIHYLSPPLSLEPWSVPM